MKILMHGILILTYLFVALSVDEGVFFKHHNQTAHVDIAFLTPSESQDTHSVGVREQHEHGSKDSGETDCPDCHVGFCVHSFVLPAPVGRNFSTNLDGQKATWPYLFHHQDPFFKRLNRPPIA